MFYIGGTKYAYQLELDERQVYLERLNYYKSVQPTMVFVRELKDEKSVITYNASTVKLNSTEKE